MALLSRWQETPSNNHLQEERQWSSDECKLRDKCIAKAEIEKSNRIFSVITLDTTDGEITKFKVRNKLGENFLIIGLPSEIFGPAVEGTETIVYIVPRLVRLLKTDEKIKNKI